MANFNMSAIRKIVNELQINAQLIPSPSQPLNCKYVIIEGKQLKSSQWTKTQAENILIEYKEGGCNKNSIPDDMSYFNMIDTKSNLQELIHFQDEALTYCLESFRQLQEQSSINSVNSWVNTMTDFFTNEISNKTDVEGCANKIKMLIDTKEVFIINGFVYSNKELENVIKTWKEVNNINSNINIMDVIIKYSKRVNDMLNYSL